MSTRYEDPNRVARGGNAVIRWLVESVVSVAGTCALRVRDRKTGKPRSVVINLLTIGGVEYLVSPAATPNGHATCGPRARSRWDPRWRQQCRLAAAVEDAAKPELLKRYLDRWYWQVKGHVAGLTPHSIDEEFRAAAPSIPVFVLGSR